MKTISLVMPDGTEKEFKQVKNTLNTRIKLIEFDKQSEGILIDNTAKIDDFERFMPDNDEGRLRVKKEMTAFAKDTEIGWIVRGIDKTKLMIDRSGLTDEENALIDSDANGDFWANQDLQATLDFRNSF